VAKGNTGFLSKTVREKVIPNTILGGSIGLQAIGGLQQASNIEAAGGINARALRDSAAVKKKSAELSAEKFARGANRLQERNRAAAGASGFQMSGSMLDAMADTAAQLELQKQIDWSAKVEQNQMMAQATNTRRLASAQADQARTSAFADLAKGLFTMSDLF